MESRIGGFSNKTRSGPRSESHSHHSTTERKPKEIRQITWKAFHSDAVRAAGHQILSSHEDQNCVITNQQVEDLRGCARGDIGVVDSQEGNGWHICNGCQLELSDRIGDCDCVGETSLGKAWGQGSARKSD